MPSNSSRLDTIAGILAISIRLRVNLREYPPLQILCRKINTINCLVTIKNVKRRESLNEDVFEASVVHFFIVFHRTFWGFCSHLLKIKPSDEFFPSN